MTDKSIDQDRQARIDKILADIDCDEQAFQSWFYYLEAALSFPFQAKGRSGHASSWPGVSDVVTVISMDDEESCGDGMFVMVGLDGDAFSVSLDELEAVEASAQIREAMEDWHCWAALHT